LLRIRASALPYGRYFTQSGGTNTPNTELAAETSINIAGINTIYVWFEDTTVTPTCTKKSFYYHNYSFFSITKYTNQFSCTSYTLPKLKWRCLLFKSNKGLPIIPPGTSITAEAAQ
jgi:hypothetical protein